MGPGSSRPDSFPLGSWNPAPRRRPLSRRTPTSWVRRTRLPLWRKLFLRTWSRRWWQEVRAATSLLRLLRSSCRVPALSSRSSFRGPFRAADGSRLKRGARSQGGQRARAKAEGAWWFRRQGAERGRDLHPQR